LKDLGIAHHRPQTLLMWEAQVVHHVEDVTNWVEVKLRALEAHASQF
jgi:LmbE family N-acetylglucosaminyl deacetylase